MSPTPKLRYQITLEGAAGADSANSANTHALKQLLKRLLRSSAALRCTDIRQIDDRRADHDSDGGKR